MEQYKGFYGTREEYVEFLKKQVTFWAKAFSTEASVRGAMCMALCAAEEALAAEGFDWDEIEAIEIAGMCAA